MTTKKPATEPKTQKLWLTRNSTNMGHYGIHVEKPEKLVNETYWPSSVVALFCPKVFERHTPADCHLKRGGGPLCIRIVRDEEGK